MRNYALTLLETSISFHTTIDFMWNEKIILQFFTSSHQQNSSETSIRCEKVD